MNTTLTCRLISAIIQKSQNLCVVDTSDILPGSIAPLMMHESFVGVLNDVLISGKCAAVNDMQRPITDPESLYADRSMVIRFLFSVGFLTYAGGGSATLIIPNQQALIMLSRAAVMHVAKKRGTARLEQVLHELACGNIALFCEYVEEKGLSVFDCVRDSIHANELTLKAIIATYISSTENYLQRSERAVPGGYIDLYADLVDKRVPEYYSLLFEIKRLRIQDIIQVNGEPISYDHLFDLKQDELTENVYVRTSLVESLLSRYAPITPAPKDEPMESSDEESVPDEMDVDDDQELIEDSSAVNEEMGSFVPLKHLLDAVSIQANGYASRVEDNKIKVFVVIGLGFARLAYKEVSKISRSDAVIVLRNELEVDKIIIQRKARSVSFFFSKCRAQTTSSWYYKNAAT